MSRSQRSKIPEPLTAGDRLLDRYVIHERLTSGGHSVVYVGEDERLHRQVCIKVFHRVRSADGPYKTAYEHFVQEAFALSKLTHPNTLRIYDFGHLSGDDGEDGTTGPPFQVSEFMTHGTLWSQVKHNGPLPADEAIPIIEALSGALAEAHHAGLIHRDIKPHNILFTAAGTRLVAKLADFGIAKALPSEGEQLRNRADDTSVVVGRPFLMYSPWWAAPEQLAGMTVEQPADIYALALCIVYMFTGKVVFRENDAITAYEQRKDSGRYLDLACEGADIPLLARVQLQQACEFHPQDRPDDAEEFAAAIIEALRAPSSGESSHASARSLQPTAPIAGPEPQPEATSSPAMAVAPAGTSGAYPVPESDSSGAHPAPGQPNQQSNPQLSVAEPQSGSHPHHSVPQALPQQPSSQQRYGQPTTGASGPLPAQTGSGPNSHQSSQSGPHLQPLPGSTSDHEHLATPPRRLRLAEPPQIIAERHIGFRPAESGEAVLECLGGTIRVRVAFVPGANGFCLHVRGLNCFIAQGRGRPSSAALFQEDGMCHFVMPSRQPLGGAMISLGKAAAGHRVFSLDAQPVAISLDECPQVAALDFGPRHECLFVYRPAVQQAPTPPSRPRFRSR